MKITRLTREITKTVCVAVLALGAMFSFTSLAMAEGITPLTITGITIQDKVYDGSNTASFTGTPQLANPPENVSLIGDLSITFNNVNVGTQSVTLSGLDPSGASSTEYSLDLSGFSAEITKAPATINIDSGSLVQTYDGTPKSVTYTTTPTGLSADLSDTPVNAGEYSITATINDTNYIATDTDTLVVNKAPLTITAEANNKTYDGTISAVVTLTPTTGVISGDTVNLSYTTATFSDANVGNNKIITVEGITVDNNNYSLNSNSVTITANITQATQTIDFPQIPNKTFGDAGFMVSAASDSGLTVVLSSLSANCTVESGTISIVHAGTCSILAQQVGNNNFNAASQVTNTFQINKADPVITWNNPADITYGTALNSIQLNATASVSGNYVYTPASNTILSVGPHTLHVEFTPTNTTDYNSVSKDVTINVLPKQLTVTADSKTKEAGEGDPSFTYTVSGLVNNDDSDTVIGGSLTRESGNYKGEYTINQGTLSVGTNYSITFNSGLLTITDTIAPSITAPAAITVEATGINTTVSNLGTPIVFDYGDASPESTNDAPTLFPLGDTTVTWTATDESGHSSVATQTITIEDTTGPVISSIADINDIEATATLGAYVDYINPEATDLVDGSVSVSCSPVSGLQFPIASNTVTCTAEDSHSNLTTSQFTVTVVDTTDPVITAPENVIHDVNYVSFANRAEVALGTPIVSDIGDASPTFINNAPETFPLGDTIVTWTATDASGNSATAEQTVTITDTTAPVLTITSTLQTNDTTPTITGTTDDNTSNVIVTINDQVYQAIPSDGLWTITTDTLSENQYDINVSSTDLANNIGEATGNITIDTTKPTVSSYLPSSGALDIALTNPITLTFSEPININESNVVFSPSFTDFIVTGSGTNQITITPSSNLASNTNYSVVISGVEDLVGNVIQNSHDDINFTTITAYSIPLYHRENNSWNLISLPVTPTNSNIATVLGNASTKIDAVWTYDPSNPNSVDGWLSYFPNDPTETNNLTSMSAGYGYWINANDDASVSGLGTLLSVGPNIPASRSLSSGWNLIGYYQLSEETYSTPASSFTSLGGEYSALWGFQNEGGSFKNVGLSSNITPGEAFWISLPSTKEYTPANQNN